VRVFIDANIYLMFFEAKNEKLSSLSVFRRNMSKKGIELVFPKITYDEILRRIPKIKAESIKELAGFIPRAPKLPATVRSKKTSTDFDIIVEEYREKIRLISAEYVESVDKLLAEIDQLFSKAKVPGMSSELLQRAMDRHLLGNPPGKGGHNPIGDELEWEILLEYYQKDDLIIITNDHDWKEYGSEGAISTFLKKEWRQKSGKELQFYSSLGEFVNDKIKPPKPIDEKEISDEKRISAPIESSGGFITVGADSGIISPSEVDLFSVWAHDPSYASMPQPLYVHNPSQPLPASRAFRVCPQCGTGVTASRDRYCSVCGSILI
jgi:predicted nucleic acid-binding protein